MSEECCGPSARYDDCGCEIREVDEAPQRLRDVREIQLAAIAGVALAVGLGLSLADLSIPARVAEATAIAAGGLTFIPQSLRALWRGRLSVATLMTIAAIGAILLGEVAEAATLAFLFSVSEALESYALTRTRRGLRALLDLVPDRARVLRGGREVEVDPAALRPGEVMVVRPGERLATDGTIRAGRSALDFSAITGESVPVERGPGEEVLAAAINGGGALEVQVTARTGESSLARIVRIVEEAQERKGRGQRIASRIARPLVPGVLIAATLIAVIGSLASGDPGEWIGRSLVVLVAAAPCAFAISVPVTVVAAIGAATRSGVLIKGGAALEALASVRAVAFDKTGTLTRNDPQVVEVLHDERHARGEVLALAGALEARSEHPLARAILASSPGVPAASDVQAHPGDGISGRVDGVPVRLGRPGFVDPGRWAERVLQLERAGATVVLLARDGRTVGAIAVRDELRPEAAEAVRQLHGIGIAAVAMVSGDNERTANALAGEAGIDRVHAQLRPEDKVDVVERLQREQPVAMVGDGINDAPALASARVGIAMGAMGTDVAIESADVALMGEDLRTLPRAIVHARRAGRIMRQNLLLSGAIIVALIPLAATGLLGLAAVVAIHELAEVVVIGNGVRAARRGAFATPEPERRPPTAALRPFAA